MTGFDRAGRSFYLDCMDVREGDVVICKCNNGTFPFTPGAAYNVYEGKKVYVVVGYNLNCATVLVCGQQNVWEDTMKVRLTMDLQDINSGDVTIGVKYREGKVIDMDYVPSVMKLTSNLFNILNVYLDVVNHERKKCG